MTPLAITLGTGAVTLLIGAVLVGSVLQAMTGFGVGLTVMPVLAAIAPSEIPGTVLLLGLPLAANNVIGGWQQLDRRGTLVLSAARMVGIVGGVALVTVLSSHALQVACLAVVVLCVVAFLDWRAFAWMSWLPAAGTLSGFTGAVSGVGGPALATALRHRELTQTRATSGMVYLIGTSMTLALLAAAHELTRSQLALGLLLLPIVIIGAVVGNRRAAGLDPRTGRQLLLGVVLAGALILAWRVWVG